VVGMEEISKGHSKYLVWNSIDFPRICGKEFILFLKDLVRHVIEF